MSKKGFRATSLVLGEDKLELIQNWYRRCSCIPSKFFGGRIDWIWATLVKFGRNLGKIKAQFRQNW